MLNRSSMALIGGGSSEDGGLHFSNACGRVGYFRESIVGIMKVSHLVYERVCDRPRLDTVAIYW